MKVGDVISIIEEFANPRLQEDWDNTGFQLGDRDAACTGVLVCVDVTPAIVQEAADKGCNLVVSHHPLFFRGIKQLTGANLSQITAIKAIKNDVAIYSSHTAADSAKGGVSYCLAERLRIIPEKALSARNEGNTEEGLGVIGVLDHPMSSEEFIVHVKEALGCKAVRTTKVTERQIKKVAMCGGAGGEFIFNALTKGADAYVTGDVRYHDFVDYRDKILVIDAGHYETEAPIKEAFAQAIKKAFPRLKVECTTLADNPVDIK